MNTNFTPGPWVALEEPADCWTVIAKDAGPLMLVAAGLSADDARLIATVPELLEALEALLESYSSPNRIAARKVVAKARGEQK